VKKPFFSCKLTNTLDLWVAKVDSFSESFNFSTCFSDTPLTCNERWPGFLER